MRHCVLSVLPHVILTMAQERGDHMCALSLVGCDDAQLIGQHARLQEACEQLLHIGGLSAVQVAGAC
jgi:hypothetical protein